MHTEAPDLVTGPWDGTLTDSLEKAAEALASLGLKIMECWKHPYSKPLISNPNKGCSQVLAPELDRLLGDQDVWAEWRSELEAINYDAAAMQDFIAVHQACSFCFCQSIMPHSHDAASMV